MTLEDLVVEEVLPSVFCLLFAIQKQHNTTLVRIVEHYESPHFKGKVFSRKEFREWYIAHSEKGRQTGKYTYNSDWHGFNIPGDILEPFYSGDFDPLSQNERAILTIFEAHRGSKFYIISTYKKNKLFDAHKRHEMGHALFYLDGEYRKRATAIVESLPKEGHRKLNARLREMGYHNDVLVDETQAYLISIPPEEWKIISPEKIRESYETMNRMLDTYLHAFKERSLSIYTQTAGSS